MNCLVEKLSALQGIPGKLVKRGGRAAIVNVCIQMSPTFPKLKKCILTENMRTDKDEIEFSEYLLILGEGKEETYDDLGDYVIKIPDEYLTESKEKLIEQVIPNLCKKKLELTEGAIYTPLNKESSGILIT